MALAALKTAAASMMVGIAVSDELGFVAMMRGRSMQPTLNPGEDGSRFKGDIVLVNRLGAHNFKYSRGDVVVFRSPLEPKDNVVKRLIGLEGDVIRLPGTSVTFQVPRGHCWVEGDNLGLSHDSRDMGPIPIGLLQGRVTRILWPPSRFKRVDTVYPTGRILSKPN